MNVEDNVLIGQHVHTPTPVLSIIFALSRPLSGRIRLKRWQMHVSEKSGLNKKSELARNLSYGQQKLVEFARALAAQPELILWMNLLPA